MSRKLSNIITLVLALIGTGIAGLLTYKHFAPDMSLGCSAIGGCGSVLSSAYSKVGGIPTAMIGLGMYLTIIGICLVRHKRIQALPSSAPSNSEGEEAPAPSALKPLNGLLWGITTLGVLISWSLQYFSIYTLHSFCPYCFSSAVTITLLCVVTAKDFWLEGRTLDSEQKLVIGVVSAVLLLGIFSYVPKIVDFLQNPPEKPKEDPEAFAQHVIRPETHLKGDPNAPLTIVEFADFQCETCKSTYPKVEDYVTKHPKQFRYAFRHFPLPIHRMGYNAAIASEAAAKQGKYWEMVIALFAHQGMYDMPVFTEESFADIAKDLGLNVERFRKDTRTQSTQDIVLESAQDARDGGISSTPSFVVVNNKTKKLWHFKGAPALFEALDTPSHEMYH